MAYGGPQSSQGDFLRLRRQGYAVFIVNIEPKGKQGDFEFQHRNGAREDSGNLQTIFVENLGFEWINRTSYWHQNLTVGHWDHRKKEKHKQPMDPKDCCLRCHIQSLDHSQSSCFVLAISSHGRELAETEIIFSDGCSIRLTEIFDVLSDKHCPTLKGIPRIIILQACRSNYEDKELVERMQDHGITIHVEMNQQTGTADAAGTSTCGVDQTDDPTLAEASQDCTFQQTALNKMPENFILVYPCVSRQWAQRNEIDGSWLIHGMKKIVSQNCEIQKPVNFLHVLTQVAGYIARERETTVFKHEEGTQEVKRDEKGGKIIDEDRSGVKNAVCIHHKLVKTLIFYPKVKDETDLDQPSLDFSAKKRRKKRKIEAHDL